MTPSDLSDLVDRVFSSLKSITHGLEENPDLIGSLSLEDYHLITTLIKDYLWERGE